MAENAKTVIYKVGDEYQDANGKKVEAPKTEKSTTGEGSKDPPAFPDGFPHRTELEKAGVKSAADAQKLTREALIALPNIGAAKADAILAFKVEG